MSGQARSRKLKVTLLSSEWKSTKGGMSTINRELAIQLAKHQNVEVSMYLPRCSEEDVRVAWENHVKLIQAKWQNGWFEPIEWLSLAPENHEMDYVIGQGLILGKLAQLIQMQVPCKWIQVVHTAPEDLVYANAILIGKEKHQEERDLCELADEVVAAGSKLAYVYSRYLRHRGDQTVFELTPSIFSEFVCVKQAAEERRTFHVLVFGHGDTEDFELKGYDIAAKAICELNEESYQLIFVGAPLGREEEVAKILCQYGIAQRQLTVRSFKESREDLLRLFCEVDLCIMPLRTESFGLAALEALSAGLPILVSGISGFGHALQNVPYGSSSVVHSEDPLDWAKAIKSVRKRRRDVRLKETKDLCIQYAEVYSWEKQCGELVGRMLDRIFGTHHTTEEEQDPSLTRRDLTIPPEILARGSSATKSYFKAVADGRTSLKRVPVMLIGQDGAGKTSLKKSLKGICFDPNEESTVGIDVDPSHFKVTTETWRTGTAGDEQDADAALSFDYHAARWIVDDLKEKDESPLIQTSTTEIKTSGDSDETKITRQFVISETEGDAKRDETLVEPATVPNEEALNNSSSPIEHNPKSLSDFTRYIPEEIAVGTETLLKGNFEDNRANIYSCLFDFAGQSVYYVTHQLFLTGRAIYCLVYNLSLNPDDPAKPRMKQGVYQKYQDTFNLKTNLDYLDFWMRSVASVANTTKTATEAGLRQHKLPLVFLVCTHADAPYDKNSYPRDLAYKILGRLREKPYGVHLFDVYVVDNTKSGTANECSEVIRLRQEILAVAEQLPYINEAIPIKWLKFEKAITALKKQKKGNKCISLKDARDIATNDCNITEKREIRTLLDYLNDLKSIIHFDDTPELNELVVLDPQWLIDVFKKVITVQPAYQCEEKKLLDKWEKLETGLLDEKLLRHTWKSLSDDEETYQSLIAIMEKFSLMCPWPLDASDASGNKSYLVPSMLKSHPPKEITELVASSELPSLFLRFEDGHVPAGLFPRLVLAIFQWGKDEFWETAKLHLFCNFARYFTSTDNDCSVIFVCHSSSIEIVVHNANIGLDSIEDLVRDLKMSYSPGFQRDNTNSNVTFTRAVCSQVGLTLECMRHEFCLLKNMRYEMSVICTVCCHRGGVNFCPAHCKQGCKEEECLHFWPISELRTVKSATFCTRSASAKDIRVPVSQFTHWFPPVSHKVSQSGTGDSYKNFAFSSEGNEDKALALPDKLQESLASPSCDPQQIVSLFKEKQPLMEAVSLEKPEPQQMKWIRCLSREANIAKRVDVVQHLRSISPEGTVGPLLSENLDVREIPFEQGRQLTIALSGGDEWKLVAEKLGLNPREIRYLDNRIRNPADAVLGFVAEKRGLTVGELYDVLSNCGLPLLADEL